MLISCASNLLAQEVVLGFGAHAVLLRDDLLAGPTPPMFLTVSLFCLWSADDGRLFAFRMGGRLALSVANLGLTESPATGPSIGLPLIVINAGIVQHRARAAVAQRSRQRAGQVRLEIGVEGRRPEMADGHGAANNEVGLSGYSGENNTLTGTMAQT